MVMLSAQEVLQAAARLHASGYVRRTPLEECESLSASTGAQIFQKLEIFQRTGSFKLRGATNKLLKLAQESPDSFKRGFVTASAGNHALGMSYSARELKAQLTVVVPRDVSPAKLESLRHYPIEVIIAAGNYDVAEHTALQLAEERGYTFISAYNDPDVAAGQGTLALEALEDLPEADALLVPLGGGGLVSGIAIWAKTIAPNIKLIGVQSEASPALYESLKAGKIVQVEDLPSLADGLSGNIEENAFTFLIAQQYLDEAILVKESEIAEAIRYHASELRYIVEGSAAVGMAALLAGKISLQNLGKQKPRIIDFVTGRNISATRLKEILNS
ncbi:MAG: threonine/serine dehydratase [Chloroflexi bacterium]|uniref:threonine ammonia-lyase n=2 Tax=Candidatus Chlorohelix allophototropha TaxID=3003348 RepID=A0A8T7M5R1_9CHLR|nr:threonine/serine dehydratase [Chloroflexota bacterium]